MAEVNGEFPTVIGSDARFKGEISFDKGVRIEGAFDGTIKSKGTLHVAEGAKVSADVEAANVRVEGECKGNLFVSEKLHLLATARMEGDLHTNRLEIADGAIFIGNVVVGQSNREGPARSSKPQPAAAPKSATPPPLPARPAQPKPPSPGGTQPRPRDIHIPGGSA
jgi:cytoskeletal protein CcmA (bactofilin family)